MARVGSGGPAGIGPVEATRLLDTGALLLDVREHHEWSAGHAPGARHLPLGELRTRLASLPGDVCVVVVCRSGRRSAEATEVLMVEGFDAVNLDGGMLAWVEAGCPLEAPDGTPGSVV